MRLPRLVGVGRIAACVNKDVAILHDFDIVVTDRHAHGKLTIGIGLNEFAVLGCWHTIDVDVAALHGIVGAGIAHVAADGEGGDVFEVNAVMNQRRGTDIARQVGRRELVDAHRGDDRVVGALAAEGYATDNVVALSVGHAHQAQLFLGRHVAAAHCRHVGRGVVAVAGIVALREVVDDVLHAHILVHRVVDGQVALSAAHGVVEVLADVVLREGALEEAELVEIAAEVVGIVERHAVAQSQPRLSGGGCHGLPRDGAGGDVVGIGGDVERGGLRRLAVDTAHVAPLVGRDGHTGEAVLAVDIGTQLIGLPRGIILQHDGEEAGDVVEHVGRSVAVHLCVAGVHVGLYGEVAANEFLQLIRGGGAEHTRARAAELQRAQVVDHFAVVVVLSQRHLHVAHGGACSVGDAAADDTRRQGEACVVGRHAGTVAILTVVVAGHTVFVEHARQRRLVLPGHEGLVAVQCGQFLPAVLTGILRHHATLDDVGLCGSLILQSLHVPGQQYRALVVALRAHEVLVGRTGTDGLVGLGGAVQLLVVNLAYNAIGVHRAGIEVLLGTGVIILTALSCESIVVAMFPRE